MPGESLFEVQKQFSNMVTVAEVAKQSLCACVHCLHILQCSHLQPQVPECMCVTLRERMRESALKGTRSMKHSSISKGQGVHCEASLQKPSSHFYVNR